MSLNVPESSPTDELARFVFPLSVNDGGSTDSFLRCESISPAKESTSSSNTLGRLESPYSPFVPLRKYVIV